MRKYEGDRHQSRIDDFCVVCPVCGLSSTIFDSKRRWRLKLFSGGLCSRCYERRKAGKLPITALLSDKICDWCERPFMQDYPWQRFCSIPCQTKNKYSTFTSWRRANPEWQAEHNSRQPQEVLNQKQNERQRKEAAERQKILEAQGSLHYADGKLNYRLPLLKILASVTGYLRCVYCGLTDMRYLEVDHINGGGKADERRFHGRRGMYRYYVRMWPLALNTLQVLCGDCNTKKRRERKEYEERA